MYLKSEQKIFNYIVDKTNNLINLWSEMHCTFMQVVYSFFSGPFKDADDSSFFFFYSLITPQYRGQIVPESYPGQNYFHLCFSYLLPRMNKSQVLFSLFVS